MLFLIPLVPLIGFVLNASVGRRLSKSVSGGVATGAMVASFVVSLTAVSRLAGMPAEERVITERFFDWISSGAFNAELALRLDPLSAVMILIVSGIGALIHLYSAAYMHEEPGSEYARYFSYLNLFAAFMLVLVLGSNFLVMFVGWEGVGLCSYLLIGFWYRKKSASDAGKKAFIVNRIGDFGFLLGVLLIFTKFRTIDFYAIAQALADLAPEAGFGTLSLMTLLLFIGATGKSAQIPLFVWLPDAMEGPTPVSALIHAATMVTAGVYMIGRNAVLFSHAPETLTIIAIVGVLTAFVAGTIALVQNDIKRVLAYSTVSQLGYMVLAMGVGAFSAGLFHLYTHAFFKALLFLGSGAVIHALAGEQDLRRMGGLRKELRVTYWTFLIGALAIAGVPGLSGFFSKDEILYRTFASGHVVLWALGLVTSLLTAIYMFRLVFLAFHGERAPAAEGGAKGGHLHDAPPAMAIVLVVLAVGSVVAGYAGFPHALGGSNRFEAFLHPVISGAAEAAAEPETAAAAEGAVESDETVTELTLMVVSSLLALAGIGIAWFMYLKRREIADQIAERFVGARTLLEHKYYVDEIYDAVIVQPIRIVSENALWKIIDARVIDGFVNGMAEAVAGTSAVMRRLQTGSVRAYAASLFLGVVIILGYYVWQ